MNWTGVRVTGRDAFFKCSQNTMCFKVNQVNNWRRKKEKSKKKLKNERGDERMNHENQNRMGKGIKTSYQVSFVGSSPAPQLLVSRSFIYSFVLNFFILFNFNGEIQVKVLMRYE